MYSVYDLTLSRVISQESLGLCPNVWGWAMTPPPQPGSSLGSLPLPSFTTGGAQIQPGAGILVLGLLLSPLGGPRPVLN